MQKKRYVWGLTTLLIVVVAVFVACVTFPSHWGARLAEKIALAILPYGAGAENELHVARIGLSGVRLADVRLGGMPMAPSFTQAEVRFSLSSLRSRTIDSIDVQGLSIDPKHQVENFAMPSLGSAGRKCVPDDPLQGWTIRSAKFTTEEVDFSGLLPPPAEELLGAGRCGLSLEVAKAASGYMATIDGHLFGMPVGGGLKYDQSTASGTFELALALEKRRDGSQTRFAGLGELGLNADFAFSGTNGLGCVASGEAGFASCEWNVDWNLEYSCGKAKVGASIDGAPISEKEPLAAFLLSLAPMPDTIKDIAFSSDVEGKVGVEIGKGDPRWSVAATVDNVAASLKASGIPIQANGGRSKIAIDGIGNFWKLKPVPVSFTNAVVGMVSFDAGWAFVAADERTLVINEASVGFCSGFVRIYALYLDFKRLNTGFKVMLEGLSVGDFIAQFPKLEGSTATGSLYGRLPLHVNADGAIRLGNGFLYSPPGETGNIKLADPSVVTDLLAGAGVPGVVCANLNKALRNLDYEKLRFDLEKPRQEDGRLAIKVMGKSTDGKIVTPVNLNLSVNGRIEEALNIALKTAKLK